MTILAINRNKMNYTNEQMTKLFYVFFDKGLYEKALNIAITNYNIHSDYQSLVNMSFAYTKLENKTKAMDILDYAMKKFRPTEMDLVFLIENNL